MEKLCVDMAQTNVSKKRSFVDAFLEDEAKEERSSIKVIRMKLARAENKKETSYNNLRKTKERTKKLMEKMREYEAALEVDEAEVDKLCTLLADQKRLGDAA